MSLSYIVCLNMGRVLNYSYFLIWVWNIRFFCCWIESHLQILLFRFDWFGMNPSLWKMESMMGNSSNYYSQGNRYRHDSKSVHFMSLLQILLSYHSKHISSYSLMHQPYFLYFTICLSICDIVRMRIIECCLFCHQKHRCTLCKRQIRTLHDLHS